MAATAQSPPEVTATAYDAETVEGFLRFLEQNELGVEDAEALYARPPVDIETFIQSPAYLNKPDSVFPAVMAELIECNSGRYVEAVFTGGIGSGKTTAALYTNAYQLYLLSCMRDAHGRFGLDSASEILLIFQNKTAALAKEVSYNRFKAIIDSSPYFQRYFPYRKRITSRLVFPRRIEVVPVSGQESAAIGQNVMGGIIDELNYMEVVEQSRKSVDAGKFDQAVAIYNSIARRRKSRFMQQGRLPGVLCLVSSRRYPGQFTDKKEEEARTDPTIFVYDKCTWDIRPDAYSGKRFYVHVGNLNRRPRILNPGEETGYDPTLIRAIPEEHRTEFEADIINALREIAGVSTLSSYPFFVNHERVSACFEETDESSVLSAPEVDFHDTRVRILTSRLRDLEHPRWVHVDLGLTGDSAGVVCGYVPRFVKIPRDQSIETLPEIRIDFALRVNPPRNDEINFEKIRLLLYKLRDQGMNIQWVSFDSFQSRDSIQILRQKGFQSGLASVDKDTHPYDVLKTAMYDGRVTLPRHDQLLKELLALERVPLKDKVDHPPNGCFTGDTRVALLDGTLPTFEELASRFGSGERFPVYSVDEQGMCMAWAHSPRITRQQAELVEVILDNYTVVRCTPDHLFMTLGGEWIQAQHLTPEIRLMPLYRSHSHKGGWADYERVWCPVRKTRLLTHHMALDAVGRVPTGQVIHHRDHDKRNNDPRNLVIQGREDHARQHTAHRHATDTFYVARLREGHRQYRESGGNERSRQNIERLFAEGKLKRGRDLCSVEGCLSVSNAKGLCGAHYQRMRRDRQRVGRTGPQQNHRVLSVRSLPCREDVWDITVDRTHNFALANGIIVHNSKDVADALCGCVYGLSLRRSIWLEHGISLFEIPSILRERVVRAGDAVRGASEAAGVDEAVA